MSSVYIFDSYFLFTSIRDAGEAKEILNCLVRSLFFSEITLSLVFPKHGTSRKKFESLAV